MNLPKAFEDRMKSLWGDEEFNRYKASLSLSAYHALRINTLKISVEDFLKISPFKLERVPWTENGFYYEDGGDGLSPSRHPFYYAGLYYLQEPSAMAPAQLLPVEPGDRVLDLCAAPGGKSTELAARLKGKGVLVCNDISASRTRALLKNIELFGISNSIILNETPKRLAGHFKGYFDKILIDAPCSGEGMFRKEPNMVKNWVEKGEEFYINIQSEIIEYAMDLLKPGGFLLYSTCTFGPGEDEMQVKKLLDAGFETVDLREHPLIKEGIKNKSLDMGHPEWIGNGDGRLMHCIRFFPHRVRGEGHFAALLRKKGEGYGMNVSDRLLEPGNRKEGKTGLIKNQEWSEGKTKGGKNCIPDCCLDFFNNLTNINVKKTNYVPVMGRENLYFIPADFPDLTGLHVIRSGLLAGTVKKFESSANFQIPHKAGWHASHATKYAKSTFEPAQAFSMAMNKDSFNSVIRLAADDERVIRYLKGETIETDGDRKGWQLVTVEGFPLGFGKAMNGQLKNKYNKGWRMR